MNLIDRLFMAADKVRYTKRLHSRAPVRILVNGGDKHLLAREAAERYRITVDPQGDMQPLTELLRDVYDIRLEFAAPMPTVDLTEEPRLTMPPHLYPDTCPHTYVANCAACRDEQKASIWK